MRITWSTKRNNSWQKSDGLIHACVRLWVVQVWEFPTSTQGVDLLERDQKRAKPSPVVLASDLAVRGSRSLAFTGKAGGNLVAIHK